MAKFAVPISARGVGIGLERIADDDRNLFLHLLRRARRHERGRPGRAAGRADWWSTQSAWPRRNRPSCRRARRYRRPSRRIGRAAPAGRRRAARRPVWVRLEQARVRQALARPAPELRASARLEREPPVWARPELEPAASWAAVGPRRVATREMPRPAAQTSLACVDQNSSILPPLPGRRFEHSGIISQIGNVKAAFRGLRLAGTPVLKPLA